MRFNRSVRVFASLILLTLSNCTIRAADDYKLGPDSMPQEGVPQSKVTKYKWGSKIFEGTVRDYWVYVPKQYDAAKRACVMVFQDGGGYVSTNGQFRVPTVFDNLIAKNEMPVTIGIFINPDEVTAAEAGQKPRSNRSFEYDSLSGQYARFLLEEILPEAGKKYNLTKDPKAAPFAASVPAAFAHGRWRGNGPMRFAKCWITLAASRTFAAVMFIRR